MPSSGRVSKTTVRSAAHAAAAKNSDSRIAFIGYPLAAQTPVGPFSSYASLSRARTTMVTFFSDDVRPTPFPLNEQLRNPSPLLHEPQSGLWLVFDYDGVKR